MDGGGDNSCYRHPICVRVVLLSLAGVIDAVLVWS